MDVKPNPELRGVTWDRVDVQTGSDSDLNKRPTEAVSVLFSPLTATGYREKREHVKAACVHLQYRSLRSYKLD